MNKDNATLTDRFFVGLASGVMAIVTTGVIWILLATLATYIFHIMVPSIFVWGSGVVGFAMGFLTLENYALKVLSPVWHFIYKRPLHESVTKEKWAKFLLIEAGNEANNWLLASFPTKSSEILVIFTSHLTRAKVSISIFFGLFRRKSCLLRLFLKQKHFYTKQAITGCVCFNTFSFKAEKTHVRNLR
ncbi:MAG: hypothetical protein V3V19_09125 [Cocleimonas sp.]